MEDQDFESDYKQRIMKSDAMKRPATVYHHYYDTSATGIVHHHWIAAICDCVQWRK
jgi:hypothetical protein